MYSFLGKDIQSLFTDGKWKLKNGRQKMEIFDKVLKLKENSKNGQILINISHTKNKN